MTRSLTFLAVLLALPALAQSQDGLIKLAAPGLTGVNVSEKEAEFFNEYFSEKLSARGGIRITTSTEVTAVLGLERQRQLLGCEEDVSCLVEIAGALGVDGIVIGSVARFGDSYGVNLKVIDAKSSEKWAAVSGQVEAQRGVLTFLEDAAIRMAKDVKRSASERTAPVQAPGSAADASQAPAARPASESTGPEHAGMLALKEAAARHMFRIDVPIASVGYEYRVLDFLRLGGRGRILGGVAGHSSGGYPLGLDVAALVRFEPWMTLPVSFSVHAGLGAGSYVWLRDDEDLGGQASMSLALGAELILNRVWRISVESLLLPQTAGNAGGSILSLSVGRAWLF